MPAKNPRINVVLEKPLYNAVHDLAEDEGVSMSMLMRDLVREALELREDRALAAFAGDREQAFDRGDALSHEEARTTVTGK
jgi:hypothetical protein